MPGIKNKLIDLSQSFKTLKAIDAAEERKAAAMAEIRGAFIRQGFSYWMAQKLAEEKYKHIHK